LAVPRLNRAPDQNQPARSGADDCAYGNLRIQIEDEAARGADKPLGLARLDSSQLGAIAATQAESVVL
jgi:hypothetical protein